MSPASSASGSVRSAADLNAEIRALWQRAGGRPTSATERADYARLVVEWAAAVQRERA